MLTHQGEGDGGGGCKRALNRVVLEGEGCVHGGGGAYGVGGAFLEVMALEELLAMMERKLPRG